MKKNRSTFFIRSLNGEWLKEIPENVQLTLFFLVSTHLISAGFFVFFKGGQEQSIARIIYSSFPNWRNE